MCISRNSSDGEGPQVVDNPREIRGEYEISGVLSQIDVVHYLLQTHMLPPDLLQKTIGQLNIGLKSTDTSAFVTLSSAAPAILALKMMYEHNINAIGIRDHNSGKLVGNISASDVEGFVEKELQNLSQPVLEYVATSRKINNLDPTSLISCTDESTLRQVMELFARHKLHRLYIVDDAQQFVGVVTLTDIFKCLVDYFRADSD